MAAFDPTKYLAANQDVASAWASNPALQKAFGGNIANYATSHFQNYGMNEKRPLEMAATPTATPATAAPAPNVALPGAVVVAGAPTAANQANIAQVGGQLAANPQQLINGQLALSTQVPTINANAAGTIVPNATQANGPNATVTQAGTTQAVAAQGSAVTADTVKGGQAETYTADTTFDKIAKEDMKAAQGTVSDKALVDASKLTIDTSAAAAGTSPLGAALNAAAQQDIKNVVDTSTEAGKALANQLGEGNYLDSKATVKGQLEQLASEFVDSSGNPKIPIWAQGSARNVSKIAAFGGMTGSAATAAMASAIMESSIAVAQSDATFYQTLTVKNLDNRQQQTINKAGILANLELANLDARTTAAVQNSQAFLQMDLANLSNEQQARTINTQSRVQSILEDSKAINTQRLFTAQSQNEMDMFYDNLNANISQFNASQKNAMTQFNVGQKNQVSQFNASEANATSKFNASENNATSKFNAELENQRQEFYKNMQYNVDVSNAKWRQTVTLTDAQMKFDAAATDVKNMVGLSVEQLNQIWDRSDAQLDYIWKSSESEKERANNIALKQLEIGAAAKMNEANNKANSKNATTTGIGQVAGTIVGAVVGNSNFADKAASALSNLLF